MKKIQFHQGPTPKGCPLCDYLAGVVTEIREEREALASPPRSIRRRRTLADVVPYDEETGDSIDMGEWHIERP